MAALHIPTIEARPHSQPRLSVNAPETRVNMQGSGWGIPSGDEAFPLDVFDACVDPD